ncbi:hypothetical protein O6H91_Y039000 [Diphasiastrum complanatum]|nr:hypothetical protein O6H91_Y039000 [Diphasiastrum complanatum]
MAWLILGKSNGYHKVDHIFSSSKSLNKATLQEAWFEIEIYISSFRVFGCKEHVHVPKKKRNKLHCKSTLCIFLGYFDT